MNPETERYIEPTETIESDSSEICETARSVTAGCKSEREKAVRLFYFVRDSIKYSPYMVSAFIEDFRASRILGRRKGYCVQKAVLLAALGRAAGIPSRLSFAKIRNHRVPEHIIRMLGTDTFPRHGYNQFLLGDRWVSAAATFDKDLCERNNLPAVEFDGKNDAFLPGKDLNGGPFIEYIEKYSPSEDLPFEWIREWIAAALGPDKRPWLDRSRRE